MARIDLAEDTALAWTLRISVRDSGGGFDHRTLIIIPASGRRIVRRQGFQPLVLSGQDDLTTQLAACVRRIYPAPGDGRLQSPEHALTAD